MKLRPRNKISKLPIEGNEDGDDSDEIDVSSYVSDCRSEDVASSSEDFTEPSEKKLSEKKQRKRTRREGPNFEEKVGNDAANVESQPNQRQETIDFLGLDDEKKVGNDAANVESQPNQRQETIDFLGLDDEKQRRKYPRKGKPKPILMWNVWEKENERWIDENIEKDFDLGEHNEVMTETVEPPAELTMPLLRYQKEWLAWALKQEDSPIKGGILADEMGMGKTIQAIALVLAKREISRTFGHGTSLLTSSSEDFPSIKATLVVCPVVAVSQWKTEIDRFTLKGSNKVLVYHGSKRAQSFEHISDYDFVITTYSVVEFDYRILMPPKDRCPYCGKLYDEKRLKYHLKYICGPEAVKTEKQSRQQKKRSTIQKRKFTQEKSAKDKDTRSELGNSSGGVSLLHSVKWDRIILDEAHVIKDRQSNTAKAIVALSSSYKWALSGTPLQNRIGELYSLIHFLQIVPYSFYLCKDCDCRTLDHRSSKCLDCPHNRVRHFCWWNKYIASRIQTFGRRDGGRRAMIFLKHKILSSILLRRTKKGRAADLALPSRIVTLRRDTLDIQEEDYYESLYHDSKARFNTFVQAGTLSYNYAHIFDLLIRLRQAVNHPYLVVYPRNSAVNSGTSTSTYKDDPECGFCHEPAEDPVVSTCKHIFCKACLIDFSASSKRVACPSCSKMLTVDLSKSFVPGVRTAKMSVQGFQSSSILNRLQLENFQTSTKIEALREEIRFMFERDGSAKGIVFSQFTSFLDLINYSLYKSGVNCVQLTGNMSMSQRDNAINKFIRDPDCKIFLMSLKAGGVALNLTVASHVFLMDPWWNPAVERQAQDRIHRIGQYKPIRIVRFIIENSIEERILRLQEKKELIFEGTVGGCNEALGKLSDQEMMFLFN